MDLLFIEVKLRLLVVYYLSLQSILACILKIDWIIDFLRQLLISRLFAITLGKEQPLAHYSNYSLYLHNNVICSLIFLYSVINTQLDM